MAIKITETQKQILDAIRQSPSQFRPLHLKEILGDGFSRASLDSGLKKLKELGLVASPKFGIWAHSKKTFISDSKIEISQWRKNSKKPTRKVSFEPEPEPPTIDISDTANDLADSISRVLKENSDLRALLREMHSRIGTALDIKPTQTNED